MGSMQIHRKGLIMKDQFTQLWRLRGPTVCYLQDGDPGESVTQLQSRLRGPRTRSAHIQGQEDMDVPAQAKSKVSLPPPPCSVRVLSGVEMPACIRGHTSSLSPPCQMLISSQNTFTDAPRNKVLSAMGERLGPAKFMPKINHHNWD